MTHLERLLAELAQLKPLSEWGIDSLRVLELICLAKALDKATEDLQRENRKDKN